MADEGHGTVLPVRRADPRTVRRAPVAPYSGTVTSKENGPTPDAGSSPYDEPTLQLRRDRPAMLESDDDLHLDGAAFDSPAYAAGAPYAASAEPVPRTEPDGAYAGPEPVAAKPRRGTLDLGLLILRLAVGGTLILHGLQKLVGLWGGPGLDGFASLLRDAGYRWPEALSIAGAVGEIAAGVFLVVGLLTPLAAAAVVAIMVNAVLFTHDLEPGLQYFAGDGSGFEYEVLLVAAAVSLTLTGPGRIALDGPRGWATRPFVGSFVALVLGVAAGVCLWLFGR